MHHDVHMAPRSPKEQQEQFEAATDGMIHSSHPHTLMCLRAAPRPSTGSGFRLTVGAVYQILPCKQEELLAGAVPVAAGFCGAQAGPQGVGEGDLQYAAARDGLQQLRALGLQAGVDKDTAPPYLQLGATYRLSWRGMVPTLWTCRAVRKV